MVSFADQVKHICRVKSSKPPWKYRLGMGMADPAVTLPCNARWKWFGSKVGNLESLAESRNTPLLLIHNSR